LLATFQAEGSQEAFAMLVARHGAWVLRLCRRQLGRHQDAEDATQAVFLALARHPERIHASVPGWLHRAAHRAAKDQRRAATRRALREHAAALTYRCAHGGRISELHDLVAGALGRLPTRLRQAVVLRYLEGLGQREAAQRLGCPQGTLATRTRQGLLRMRALVTHRSECGT